MDQIDKSISKKLKIRYILDMWDSGNHCLGEIIERLDKLYGEK